MSASSRLLLLKEIDGWFTQILPDNSVHVPARQECFHIVRHEQDIMSFAGPVFHLISQEGFGVEPKFFEDRASASLVECHPRYHFLDAEYQRYIKRLAGKDAAEPELASPGRDHNAQFRHMA